MRTVLVPVYRALQARFEPLFGQELYDQTYLLCHHEMFDGTDDMLLSAPVNKNITKTLKKTSLDRGRTDRLSLTHDLTFYSLQASYGQELPACKSSRSTVSRFQTKSGNKWTDGGECITSHTNAVAKLE